MSRLLIAALLALLLWPFAATTFAQQRSSNDQPRCRTSEKEQITIACDYSPSLAAETGGSEQPRIVLTRARFSFEPSEESHMRVELTFQNAGSSSIGEARTAYLAVDDAEGRNYTRRPLPSVDFRKLAPGRSLKFSDVLLIPAYGVGRYLIHLWIPSSESQFDSSRNWFLASQGVAESQTGLNLLATFAVTQ